MSAIFDGYLLSGLSWLLQTLWSDSASRLLLITGIAYFLAYSVYAGYLSRFTGSYGGALSRTGFQLTDLITLFPTALVTSISITTRLATRAFRHLLLALLLECLVVVGGILVGAYLRSTNVYLGAILTQLSAIAFIWGIVYFLLVSHPIDKHFWWSAGVGVAQMVGLAFSISGFDKPNATSGFLTTSNPWLTSVVVMEGEVLTLILLLTLLSIPFIFGQRLGRVSLEGKTLSRVRSLSVQAPVAQLDSFPHTTKQDIWTYEIPQDRPVLLIDAFSARLGLYLFQPTSTTKKGHLVLVQQDLIQAIELYPTEEED